MSIQLLKTEQREHLKALRDKSPEVVVDLCKLALEYLQNGPNEKKYATAAKKLNMTPTLIQSAIEGLIFLLTNAVKANVTESEFENLQNAGFTMEHISILWQFVLSKKLFIENILVKTCPRSYRFRDLDWRLEGKVASRSLQNQAIPIITIKFHLDCEELIENRDILQRKAENGQTSATKKDVLVQIDPNNLSHLIQTLEQALLEYKIQKNRQIFKSLQ